MKNFYITTAIDYPNGKPHIGHVYEKVIADFYARFYRFQKVKTWFLMGTDENGQKLVDAAQKANASSTLDYVNANVVHFEKAWADLKLSHNDFIRTTESRHTEVCKRIWSRLQESGDIYFGRYSGWYCLSCEAFYPENQIDEARLCPNHGIKLEFQEEDGYFFKLSKFQEWILSKIKNEPQFLFPESARREVIARLEGEKLRDLSVSRPNSGWGIEVPGDSGHVMYTWFDALINYYAAVCDSDELKEFWPASMHVIGKDITWFHSVIWPCMLQSYGVATPSQVAVHGMLLGADGKKMSKSLGNVVDPYEVIGVFPEDSIRYFFLRYIPHGSDGKFSVADLRDKHNQDLANNYGNLAMRVLKLTAKRIGTSLSTEGIEPVWPELPQILAECQKLVEEREHHRAVELIWSKIQMVNIYLNEHEPWRIKDDEEKFRHHMINCLFAVDVISYTLLPFLPDSSRALQGMLGNQIVESSDRKFVFKDISWNLEEPVGLFPKIEVPKVDGV